MACHPTILILSNFEEPFMTKKIRRALDAAIASANLTVKSMASALGVSQLALRRYRSGTRPIPPNLLHAVAALLRYQAERLNTKAEVLDSLASKKAKSKN